MHCKLALVWDLKVLGMSHWRVFMHAFLHSFFMHLEFMLILFPRKEIKSQKQFKLLESSPMRQICVPQKWMWLFHGECLFAVDSFLVKKIEIRLNFNSEKLRACSASRRLRPLILPLQNKDEQRISSTYFSKTKLKILHVAHFKVRKITHRASSLLPVLALM